MTAISIAIAYLGTLAFVAWQEHAKTRSQRTAEVSDLLARVAVLEASAKADQQLRDTVTTLAIAAGMKPRT